MNTIVPEARITLDSGLLGQDIIVLSLEIADDFGEADDRQHGSVASQALHNLTLLRCLSGRRTLGYQRSRGRCACLPRQARVLAGNVSECAAHRYERLRERTNCDRLDLHTILDMGAVRVIGLLVGKHRLATQSVDEGSPACMVPPSTYGPNLSDRKL
jgi:hypothetical protein